MCISNRRSCTGFNMDCCNNMDTFTYLFIDHLSSNVNFFPQQEILITQTSFTLYTFMSRSEPKVSKFIECIQALKAKKVIVGTLISDMHLK